MDHAPYSPIASTSRQPYLSDSPFVPTSDIGEREEQDAAARGEQYWAARRALGGRGRASAAPARSLLEDLSDDELAMSPIRPRSSLSDGLPAPSELLARSAARRRRSPSPTSPTISSRTSPALLRTSVSTSPPPLLESRSVSARRKKQRSISPCESDDSADTLEAITSRQPKTTKRPTLPSPVESERNSSQSPRQRSPSPPVVPEDFPILIPSPPAGRSFRTRTAAQLKPFSTEQFRYTKTLLKNGWAGAVVAGPKAVELSAEEIRRKKLEQAGRKKDDLGGWLLDEVGEGETREGESGRKITRESQTSTGYSSESSNGDESQDGLSLLEREARRKEKMRRETDAGLGIKRKQDKSRTKSTSPRRRAASRIDGPQEDQRATNPLFVKKHARSRLNSGPNRPRAESEPASSSPGISSRQSKSHARVHTTSKRDRPAQTTTTGTNRRKSTSARADSEPPASSPARPAAFVSKPIHRKMAKPSKAVHPREGRAGRSALDADILNLPAISSGSESEDVQIVSLNGESEVPDESEEEEGGSDEEEEAEEGEGESPQARRSRLRLDSKRQRALGAMLPAVFFKKAKADLKLMERERDLGLSSGSEINSGDEEAEDARKNKAKKRTVARMRDEPMRLDGDAFTDESGEEPNRTDSEAEEEEREENDAVSAWMRNFAPKRARGPDEDEIDIVDRFLKRARRPTKRGTRTGRNASDGRAKGGQGDKSGKDKKKGKAHDRIKGTGQRDGAQAKGHRPSKSTSDASSRGPRPPRKTVQLDTDRSIFVFAGLRNELDDNFDSGSVIAISAGRPQPPPVSRVEPLRALTPSAAVGAAVPEDEGEVWATFGKFTPDFGIRRLSSGAQLSSPDSFVRSGYLYSLIHPATTSLLSCDVYGLTLGSTAAPEHIESQLPTLVDAMFDSISSFASSNGEEVPSPMPDTSRTLRYLGSFVSSTVACASSDAKYRFGSALATHLDHLEARLDNVKAEGPRSQILRTTRICLSWYAVDLTARLGSISAVGGDSRRLARLVANLVRRLVQHGVDRSLASLRTAMQDSSTGPILVPDVTIEAWTGLVALATRSEGCGDASFDENDLWIVTLEETLARLPEGTRTRGPIAGEIVSLTAMFLCAVSQFSPSGISTSNPRFRAHWPAMLRSLEPIKASALAGPDHAISSTAITRRDRYLWTLFARCLIFVERWNWKLDVKDDLLGKLFDFVSARRLSNLSTEPIADFPPQLVELDKFGTIALDRSTDTAFSIFLKLVTSAVNNLPDSTDAEKRKRSMQLTRLSVRLVPMSTAWNRQSLELTKSDSVLVNHYSLLLTLAILHPTQAAQKVEQASKLLTFSDTDEDARKATVRAIRYWALAFRHFDIAIQPLLEWLSNIVSQLTTEYIDVEKQKRVERSEKSKGDQLWPRALLITMSLRLVQDVLRWRKAGTASETFPDPALLDPAWTSKLLQSALALDPMIGREVLKTIDCFLNLRKDAVQAISSAQGASSGQHDSQDDYGMDEFDFEDPALDALLGLDAIPTDQALAQSQAALERDKVFAKAIKSNLAPAFFSLASRIYGNSIATGPTVGDRSSYANDVIESWTRCIAVLVSNGLDTWSSYLRYGDYSFQRIGDALGKLDTSLFLAVHILELDDGVYSSCTEEILTIWFTTIVSSKLTSQHILTEILLTRDSPSPLFENVPFYQTPTAQSIKVDQLELLDKRIDFLRVVFSNAARIAAFQPSTAALFAKPPISKTVIMRYLRELLSAMRTYFSAIRDETAKRTYSKLVRDVLEALTSAGQDGTFNEKTLPDIAILRAAISAYL